MELATTPTLEGRKIVRYCGIVSGQAVLGANLFKDMFAGIRDLVGGRSGSYEKELRKARRLALDDLSEEAGELGANAVVGIDLDYEVLGEKNGMLMVTASGTAKQICPRGASPCWTTRWLMCSRNAWIRAVENCDSAHCAAPAEIWL